MNNFNNKDYSDCNKFSKTNLFDCYEYEENGENNFLECSIFPNNNNNNNNNNKIPSEENYNEKNIGILVWKL